MRPFHEWVSAQENSIEDRSEIKNGVFTHEKTAIDEEYPVIGFNSQSLWDTEVTICVTCGSWHKVGNKCVGAQWLLRLNDPVSQTHPASADRYYRLCH